MAVAATHLDFHTLGAKTSTGAKMRARQSDQVGGTDAYDAQRAWATYAETLIIRNGRYWADLVTDRERGWFIELDVWYGVLPDRCQANGQIGHTIGIAPEINSVGQWLVSDPLCFNYKWMKPSDLRAASEEWGGRMNIGRAIAYTTAQEAKEADDMARFPIGIDPKIAAVRPGARLYQLDMTPDITVTSAPGASSPYVYTTGGVHYRVVVIPTGGIPHLWLVRPEDCVLTPVPDGGAIDTEDASWSPKVSTWVKRITTP